MPVKYFTPSEKMKRLFWFVVHEKSITYNKCDKWKMALISDLYYKCSRKNKETFEFSKFEHCWILTSILTGSMVFICTFGADEDRSRCPNWFRWSSSGRKGCGIGMDFEGDGLVRIGGLEKSSDWKIRFRATL